MKPLRTLLTIGAGYVGLKLAAAANGDRKIVTDRNLTNATIGAVTGVYAIPQGKEALDRIVQDCSAGKKPSLKRGLRYAAAAAVGLGVAYAFDKGVPGKIGEDAVNFYNKHIKEEDGAKQS